MIAVDENLAYRAFLLESKQNELNKPRTTETGRRGATSSPPMWDLVSFYTWNRVNNKPWSTNTQQDLPDQWV